MTKKLFSYFISEIPRFSYMAFSKNAQCFVGALLSKPGLFTVYILMHGREEWVLVWHASQQERVEWPVQPVFPDCLSISCDYD